MKINTIGVARSSSRKPRKFTCGVHNFKSTTSRNQTSCGCGRPAVLVKKS